MCSNKRQSPAGPNLIITAESHSRAENSDSHSWNTTCVDTGLRLAQLGKAEARPTISLIGQIRISRGILDAFDALQVRPAGSPPPAGQSRATLYLDHASPALPKSGQLSPSDMISERSGSRTWSLDMPATRLTARLDSICRGSLLISHLVKHALLFRGGK
jgi:hypothetical protein